MASRHQRRKRALAKREACERERREAFQANERAKLVKRNLARDNRETATVHDHLGRAKVIYTNAYSGITDSFVRAMQSGGILDRRSECLNISRPSGDTDRQLDSFRKRIAKK